MNGGGGEGEGKGNLEGHSGLKRTVKSQVENCIKEIMKIKEKNAYKTE